MSFQATDLGQSQSAADSIFDALRRAIILGQIVEGAQLRQEEIAKAFNVSRIPVREAINRLKQIGLVETRRFKGAFVTGISIEEIEEIFDLRALIESDAIRRAVGRLPTSAFQQARLACDAFARSAEPTEWMTFNRLFHCALYQGGQHRHYMATIEALLDLSDRHLRAQLMLTDGQRTATREHERILQACERGDAEGAATLTFAHIQGAKTALLASLRATAAARGTAEQ